MNSAVVPTIPTDNDMPGNNNNACQTPPRSFSQNDVQSANPPCIKMAHRLAKKKQRNGLTPVSEIASHITAQVIALLE